MGITEIFLLCFGMKGFRESINEEEKVMSRIVRRYTPYPPLKKGDKEISFFKIPPEDFIDGWLPTKKYLPESYMLVSLKADLFSNSIPGWRSRGEWDGANVKDHRKYCYWKFLNEEE